MIGQKYYMMQFGWDNTLRKTLIDQLIEHDSQLTEHDMSKSKVNYQLIEHDKS